MKTFFISNKRLLSILVFMLIHFNCISNRNIDLIESSKGHSVVTGLDVLSNNNFADLKDKNIGLITNQTGVNREFVQNVELFINSSVKLKAILTPEHGLFGTKAAGEKIILSNNHYSGIPVYSLYGETRKPTKTMLSDIDILVFDIQDIGVRSYTYISTMGLAMEAAAENDLEFLILDRPNPLGLKKIEGNLLDSNFKSFIGMYPIPYVYGLTCGELANMINESGWLQSNKCKLKIIKMKNYHRNINHEILKNYWVPTSPHVPSISTPAYLVATGILGELGVFSNGVGFTMPFRTIAAPWIDENQLSHKMNMLELPGVEFRPIKYSPYYSIYKNDIINGIQIYIHDQEQANLILIQFYFLQVHHELYPDKNPFEMASDKNIMMFDKAMGTDIIRKKFMVDFKVQDIQELLNTDLNEYYHFSRKYHLYD